MKKLFCLLLALTSLPLISFSQEENSPFALSQKMAEILIYIDKQYVDDVDNNELANEAITRMLEKLDPHSVYIPKEEVDDANQRIDGSFVGIGIRFQILKDTLMVVATIPGGPSEKVGLLPGDKIISVEGIQVAGVGLKNSDVREKLMGELGTKVKVEVKRSASRKPLDFVITRDHIPLNSVDASYMITPTIGYIKLNSFSRSTTEELEKSIRELKKQGMRDLIFDLQGNGGGLLDQAQKVADQFLSGDKLIVYSEGKHQPRLELHAGDRSMFEKGRLIILTDEYTASASEIVSGAVQDWDRGMIVGRRTFGKGLVQRPIDLTDGSQIRLTIARYYTPAGRFIQKPYDNVDDYRNDLLNRYEHGEFTSRDSIRLPDSLKEQTLVTKRTVYSGGGIMPDVFVPLDTLEYSDYYRAVSRNGSLNAFALEYVEKHRDDIREKYSDFDGYLKNFEVNKKILDDFVAYVKKEHPDTEFSEKDLKTSERLIKLRIKANIAQDVWGYNEFFRIYNESNEVLEKAIEILENGTYNKQKLAQAE